MKKICALLMSFALIVTLCSCKKINKDVSDNSSYGEPTYSSEVMGTTSEILESNDSDTQSDIVETESCDDTSSHTLKVPSDSTGGSVQSTVSDNNPIENDSQDEKENNSSVNSENDSIPEEQNVYLTIDETRAPSTDVGSIIWNEYIYYTNPTSEFEDGLFRKKIIGGTEEVVTGQSVTHYRVLDEKVYYVSRATLYSCNADGSGIKKIYDGVTKFEVAGDWIFATGANSGFYVISTDGSMVKCLGVIGQIHGFNRGYCYITIDNRNHFRIDYRSQNFTQQNLKNNTEYTYRGSKHYDFIFNGLTVRYDYVLQSSGSRNWIVSLKNNMASTLFESQMLIPQRRLKDYYVYIPDGPGVRYCDINFVDFNGNTKTFRFDWVDTGRASYQIYEEQDIHGNSLLMKTRIEYANGNDVYTLHLVGTDGAVTEIYSKTAP